MGVWATDEAEPAATVGATDEAEPSIEDQSPRNQKKVGEEQVGVQAHVNRDGAIRVHAGKSRVLGQQVGLRKLRHGGQVEPVGGGFDISCMVFCIVCLFFEAEGIPGIPRVLSIPGSGKSPGLEARSGGKIAQ